MHVQLKLELMQEVLLHIFDGFASSFLDGKQSLHYNSAQKKQRESDLAIEAFVDYVDKNDPTFWEKVKPDMRRAMYGIAC